MYYKWRHNFRTKLIWDSYQLPHHQTQIWDAIFVFSSCVVLFTAPLSCLIAVFINVFRTVYPSIKLIVQISFWVLHQYRNTFMRKLFRLFRHHWHWLIGDQNDCIVTIKNFTPLNFSIRFKFRILKWSASRQQSFRSKIVEIFIVNWLETASRKGWINPIKLNVFPLSLSQNFDFSLLSRRE